MNRSIYVTNVYKEIDAQELGQQTAAIYMNIHTNWW